MSKKFSIVSVTFILLIVVLATKNITVRADKFETLPDVISQIDENVTKIKALGDMMDSTHELAEAKREYGMADNSVEIKNLKQNWDLLYSEQLELIRQTESLKTTRYDIELEILSRVIYAEAGSDCIPDECQQLVAMVVLNRVNDPRYPNNIYDVVFQKGQYACTWDGGFKKQPNERAIANAKKALDGEVACPPNVLGQAGFVQGAVYKSFPTPWSTVYFCYN